MIRIMDFVNYQGIYKDKIHFI